MPDEPFDRQTIFETEILSRGQQRGALRELRARIDKIDPEFPRERVAELLDDRALEGVGAAGEFFTVYDGLARRSVEASADGRWMSRGKLPPEVAGDGFDLLLIAGFVSRTDGAPANFGSLVTRLMFGIDPTTALFRDVVLGKPVPEDEGIPWDDPLSPFGVPFDQFGQFPCVATLQESFTEIGLANAGLPRPHPREGAVITSIEPNPVATGETVTLRGTGLGVADATTVLVFGTSVATTTLWTDTEIRALVPQLQGDCCVSIVEQAVAVGDSIGQLLEASAELSGALGDCFGAAGVVAAARLNKIPFALWTPQATCQADGRNVLWVGPPRIDVFSANDDASGTYTWRPHKPLTLRWKVTHGDSVGMTPAPQSGTPPGSVTPFVPYDALPSGSLAFGALDSVAPWKLRYTLSATNRCGTSRANLDLAFVARIGVVAVSGGMRCAFQSGALLAMGSLVETEPTVYGASGFGALTVRAAAANFRNTQPLRDFWSTVTTQWDFYAIDLVVNQLSTVDGARYKSFMISARESSTLMALGFGDRAGSYLPLPEVNFGEIWWRNGLAFGADVTDEPAGDIKNMALQSLVGASESFPWMALIVFAIKVGVDTGVAVDVRNKVAAALARKGVRDPTALMTAIDTLVGAAGPVKGGVKLRIALGNLESGDASYASENGAIVAQPLGSVVASGSLTEVLRASVSTPSWLPAV